MRAEVGRWLDLEARGCIAQCREWEGHHKYTFLKELVDSAMSIPLINYLRNNGVRNLYVEFRTQSGRGKVYSLFHPIVVPEGQVVGMQVTSFFVKPLPRASPAYRPDLPESDSS